jgi:hypothetical protein
MLTSTFGPSTVPAICLRPFTPVRWFRSSRLRQSPERYGRARCWKGQRFLPDASGTADLHVPVVSWHNKKTDSVLFRDHRPEKNVLDQPKGNDPRQSGVVDCETASSQSHRLQRDKRCPCADTRLLCASSTSRSLNSPSRCSRRCLPMLTITSSSSKCKPGRTCTQIPSPRLPLPIDGRATTLHGKPNLRLWFRPSHARHLSLEGRPHR